MKEISSKNNTKIKEASKLLCSSKKRSASGLFLVEGLRLCEDALRSGYAPQYGFVTKSFCEKQLLSCEVITKYSDRLFLVPDDILASLCDTVSPQGIVCVFKISRRSFEVSPNNKYIVLCDVADPANLGAISRTAEAFGLNGMVVCGGCDIHNPKALRASMGALFRLPIMICSVDEALLLFKKNGINTFASTPHESAKSIVTCSFSDGCAMLVGNEANGLNDEIIASCDSAVTVPMAGKAESLNAAAAAAVLIYEMMRGDIK